MPRGMRSSLARGHRRTIPGRPVPDRIDDEYEPSTPRADGSGPSGQLVVSPNMIIHRDHLMGPISILHNAVNRTCNRISDLRKEILCLKKCVVSAEQSATKAKAELDAAESKLMLVDGDGDSVIGDNPVRMKRLKSNAEKAKDEEASGRESLEAKEALFTRALDENEALFRSLYKNFSNVLMERLLEAFGDGASRQLVEAEEMAVDVEDSSAMDLDKENGRPNKSNSNGGGAGYSVGEKEQWCLSTLGHVKAFLRQYASEVSS